MARQSLEERFLSKVDVNGPILRPDLGPCHVWTGARDKRNGYPQIRLGAEHGFALSTAARVAWLLHFGEWPKHHACHHCDGGPIGCVRWDHLFDGDDAANLADMVAKGRSNFGERNGRAKLTAEQVIEIRRRYAAGGVSHSELASEFGVVRQHIGDVLSGRIWTRA